MPGMRPSNQGRWALYGFHRPRRADQNGQQLTPWWPPRTPLPGGRPGPVRKRAVRDCRSAGGSEAVSPGLGVLGMGSGEAAMKRDGGTGDSRLAAPHGGEPGNGQPGDDDDGNEVDRAEDSDVSVAREQERPAHGDDVERNDQETDKYPDAVGQMVHGLRPAPVTGIPAIAAIRIVPGVAR